MNRYRFLIENNPYLIESEVIRRGGIIIRVPLFWIYQDVYLFFEDGYIENKTVMFNNHSNAFVSVAAIYLGQTVLCRLKNKLPYANINMKKYI